MTLSLKAAGSGWMVLLSDTSTGMQVNLKPNKFLMISMRLHAETKSKRIHSYSWPHLSLQVTQMTITVKTASLFLLTTATGTTTTVNTTEDTSASAEVRYIALTVVNTQKYLKHSFSCSLFQETHLSLLHLMTVTIPHHLTRRPA